MNKISWDDYFMIQAIWASSRSPDQSTQHGSIIVDKNNKVIAQGYNGFPRGCVDHVMPQTRPEKYEVFIHSETNAILNANKSLDGSTLYVSGFPCIRCWCNIIQSGVSRVVFGPIKSTVAGSPHLEDGRNNELYKKLIHQRSIIVDEWKPIKTKIKEDIEKFLTNKLERFL